MNKSIYHILPHSRGWAIKKDGTKRISAFRNTRRGAEVIALEFAKKYGCNIAYHDGDGRIVDFLKLS